MKLDRNINPTGMGKYALVLCRKLLVPSDHAVEIRAAIKTLQDHGLIDFGNTRETDFFVIRLKDKYATPALEAYVKACAKDDPEYAVEVNQLATKSLSYEHKRKPD